MHSSTLTHSWAKMSKNLYCLLLYGSEKMPDRFVIFSRGSGCIYFNMDMHGFDDAICFINSSCPFKLNALFWSNIRRCHPNFYGSWLDIGCIFPFTFHDLYLLRQCYLRQQHECSLLKHSSQSLLIPSLNKASGHTCLLISHEHKSLGHLFFNHFQLKMFFFLSDGKHL